VATDTDNRFYASRTGQIVTVTTAGEPTPTVRKSGRVSAVDFNFQVAINLGQAQRVSVAVLTEVLTDLWPWSQKPESLDVIGRGGGQETLPKELATDLCIARILEAIDGGINFDEGFAAFPDSFLMIKGTPEPIERIATVERDDDIRGYISRRLYAARRACRKHYPQECSQFFDRPDWFYLKVGQPDFHHVITEENDSRWIIDPLDDFLLMWTDALIREMRGTERVAASTDVGAGQMVAPPIVAAPEEASPTAHPTRQRMIGSTINGWLEREAAQRGRFWTVTAQILGLILGIAALILAALAL
jgi:hypothetical protein